MLKILCIDDEDLLREDLVEILKAQGYQVLEARDGVEGIAVIVEHHPDLVICDVTMPGKTGLEVLRDLRRDHPQLSDIPFVFLTALASNESRIEGKRLGSDEYLTKPVDYELLMVTVEMQLEKAAQIATRKDVETIRLEEILKKTNDKINHLESHDPLTGLISRPEFLKILKAYSDGERIESQELVILVVEIDGLADVNDVLGYANTNKILGVVANRLRKSVHEFIKSKTLPRPKNVLSRIGDNKFAVLLGCPEFEAKSLAKNILESLSATMDIVDTDLFVSVNIGMSKNSGEETDCHNLLKYAGVACDKAKTEGPNTLCVYDTSWSEHIEKAEMLGRDLRKALKNKEFELYYQPRIDVRSGRPVGAEALIRWVHPKLGYISPAEFIPLAEATGLIIPIGEWVLREACFQLKAWQSEYGFDLDVAVNLSPAQFSQGDLFETVANTLKESGLAARNLELEITENVLVDDSENTLKTLHSIHSLGIDIAIDDFGTGYSSLSYLKRFPANTIKIDLSFVQNILTDPQDAAISGAIIEMGHAHNMAVVAEGIEMQEQADYLKLLGCDQFQGYWFSRPLPASEFVAFINAFHAKQAAAG